MISELNSSSALNKYKSGFLETKEFKTRGMFGIGATKEQAITTKKNGNLGLKVQTS